MFEKRLMDGPTDPQTDGLTDGWTDKASYTDAWKHLKRKENGGKQRNFTEMMRRGKDNRFNRVWRSKEEEEVEIRKIKGRGYIAAFCFFPC